MSLVEPSPHHLLSSPLFPKWSGNYPLTRPSRKWDKGDVFCSGLFPSLATGVGHESHEAGVLDGLGNLALVLGTQTGALGGDNLKLPRSKFTENFDVFIVNGGYFVLAGDTSQLGISNF